MYLRARPTHRHRVAFQRHRRAQRRRGRPGYSPSCRQPPLGRDTTCTYTTADVYALTLQPISSSSAPLPGPGDVGVQPPPPLPTATATAPKFFKTPAAGTNKKRVLATTASTTTQDEEVRNASTARVRTHRANPHGHAHTTNLLLHQLAHTHTVARTHTTLNTETIRKEIKEAKDESPSEVSGRAEKTSHLTYTDSSASDDSDTALPGWSMKVFANPDLAKIKKISSPVVSGSTHTHPLSITLSLYIHTHSHKRWLGR